jgi:hypothetical protein
MSTAVGVLKITLHLPGCASLKEKRARIKPVLAWLQHDFGFSSAEVDHHDVWQTANVACAMVSSESTYIEQLFQKAILKLEDKYRDIVLQDHKFEIQHW